MTLTLARVDDRQLVVVPLAEWAKRFNAAHQLTPPKVKAQ